LLLGTTGTHAINPFTMTQPTYDAVKDFAPVALIGTQPFSIAIHPSVPAQNLMELTALVKANPGKYSYASAGSGGIAHLTAELFKSLVGKLDIAHIPTRVAALHCKMCLQVVFKFSLIHSVQPIRNTNRVHSKCLR